VTGDPVDWPQGISTVTLKANADAWAGSTAALNIAWPPTPAPGQLTSTVKAMKRVPAFTLHVHRNPHQKD
jgi:hypothetical protein